MSQTFVAQDWEHYALCYDSLLFLKPYTDMLHEVSHEVRQLPHGLILDASCGTGNFEKILFETDEVDTREIIGVDTAQPMLERARQKCAKWPQCSFETVDLNEAFIFKNNTFAQVVSLNTLYAVQSPETTLLEFKRVLKPNGHILIVTPRHDYENGLILKSHCKSSLPDSYWTNVHESPEREEKLIREAMSGDAVVSDMLTVAYFNRYIAHNTSFHFYHPDELVTLLKRVGFKINSISNTYANQDIFIIAQKGE